MAIDADYQAIPYEPLLYRAMSDCDAAEAIQFFHSLATEDIAQEEDPVRFELSSVARQVVRERPGILERTFSTRAWDAVYWLLAPNRRAGAERDPHGLAEIAVFGTEGLARDATAVQGVPLRFVRPAMARTVAAYAEATMGRARDLYDTTAMEASGVYKWPWDRDYLMDLLAKYARLYRDAADADECVLVVHD
ncbi:DUF1877 family protein [Nocardia amamiensis]|uniref:DUF1877 family protein n=1 Tax=Nocardia amamiensis TaxID=404578 RepID=UPI003403D33E